MPPRKPPPLVYLDIPALAELAGVEQSTVRKYKAQGRLPEPDIMLGQSPGWTQESATAWLANRPGQGVGGGRPRKVVEPPPAKAKHAVKVPIPAKAAPAKRARKVTQ